MDRDELPFNRAERNWVVNAAKDGGTTVAFGSTKYIRETGTPIFVNCPYPTLEEHIEATPAFLIGPDSPNPYLAPSFFNISGMSFGAISTPAVLALSNGARMAGCWLNTGEGGLSPLSPGGRGRHRVPDRHGQVRGARSPTAASNEDRAARDRRLAAGQDVRDQAVAGRQARQGRHPARRQGHARNRRDPRHTGGPGFQQSQPASGDRQQRRSPRLHRSCQAPHRQAGRHQGRAGRLWLVRRPDGQGSPSVAAARISSPWTRATAAPARRRWR